jgi:hypothetical protein
MANFSRARPNQIKYGTSLATDLDVELDCTVPKYKYTISEISANIS